MTREPKTPIDQLVKDLGKYPLDAFAFVQECIGAASEKVHGPMTPAETRVARWMARSQVDLDELRHLSESGSLPEEIGNALAKAGGLEEMNRHVTGQQLCWAIRDVALERWGRLARTVLARWQIERTEDIGEIIFALVENDWLQKQPADRIEDFEHVFSFAQAFGPGSKTQTE